MASPVDAEALWMKAKALMNRSFASEDQNDFEQAALWAAFVLELLGKAALARSNPLLVADPSDDGKSLMIAAGLSPDDGKFKSIPAKAVFGRCAQAFSPFNSKEAERIAIQRNEDLHSARSPFADVDKDLWWQRFWAQAAILVLAQDRTIDEFVGTAREEAVNDHLARHKDNVARQVQVLRHRASHRWTMSMTSADTQREIARLVARPGPDLDFRGEADCPVCAAPASLRGDIVIQAEVIYDEDSGPYEVVTVSAEAFECASCALRLDGAEFVEAAGLPGSFDTVSEWEPPWDDYGND